MGRSGRGLVLVWLACGLAPLVGVGDAGAQSSARRGKPTADDRVAQALDRLESDKQAFEKKRDAAIQRVSVAFERLIKQIQREPGLDLSDRAAILKDLRQIKQRFDANQTLTASPFMHELYTAYIVAVRSGYYSLLNRYEQVLHLLPQDDARREDLENEVEQLSRAVNRLDLMQPGQVWRGYRSDDKPAARLEPKGIWMRQWKVVQDAAVNIDFTFKVTKRKGNRFLGEINQNGGRFLAEVEGTYDGVNLKMAMTRMLRGDPRQFHYAGQVVGGLGFLALEGIKTDGEYTTGSIMLVANEK